MVCLIVGFVNKKLHNKCIIWKQYCSNTSRIEMYLEVVRRSEWGNIFILLFQEHQLLQVR